MKIIVCVKQVPDTSGKVAVNPDGTLNRASMATITNPDDLNAVEAALTLKEQTGAEVVVVSMGPPPAEGMLREVIARGADRYLCYLSDPGCRHQQDRRGRGGHRDVRPSGYRRRHRSGWSPDR